MCGFLGITGNNNFSDYSFNIAFNKLTHRGPDESRIITDNIVKLGFKRLKILDLSKNGSQPMSNINEGISIVFNGEIYNYKLIKKEMTDRGVKFFGSSDTEVLLNYYIFLGRDINLLLKNCNGMFSFALIDRFKKKIYIVRDRLGVKPLYYFVDKQKLIFSSEIKSIKYLIQKQIFNSDEAIYAYLKLGFIPTWLSIYKEIKAVHPGEFGEWDIVSKSLNFNKYWSTAIYNKRLKPCKIELKEKIKEILLDATKIRLNSDVPIGIFLSGGIDSGLVAASVKRLNFKNIKAHTIRFAGSDNDETELARTTANFLGLDLRIHEANVITLEDIKSNIKHFDYPFADPSSIVTDLICKKASKESTVVLTGDGGDEAFGGYREYIKLMKYNWVNNIPDKLLKKISILLSIIPNKRIRRISNRLNLNKISRIMWTHIYPFDDDLEYLLDKNFLSDNKFNAEIINMFADCKNENDYLNIAQTADLNCYLPSNVLIKTDMMSMKNSIELRSPFLDYRLIELGLSLPAKYKVNKNISKSILRDIAKDWLPSEVCTSAKRGFGVPLEKLLIKNKSLSEQVIDQIMCIEKYKFFSIKKLKKYLENKNFSNSYLRTIYKLYCLGVFLDNQ